jgi:hypothetical protein
MMKRFGLFTVLVSVCWLTGCGPKEQEGQPTKQGEQKPEKKTQKKPPIEKAPSYSGDFRHVVLFKFKDDAPAADVTAIEKQIMDMKGKIPTIKTMEWGKDVSVENLQDGFTHAFLVTFENPDGLKVYSPHDAHQAVIKSLGPIKDKILVFDYVAGDAIPPKDPIVTAGKLRHTVMFQFKEGTTAAKIKAIEDKFRSLPASIPEIKTFEYGTIVGDRGANAGLTHCFLVTFDDAAGRTVYLPHPAHKEFVALVGPSVEKVLVIDYIATE